MRVSKNWATLILTIVLVAAVMTSFSACDRDRSQAATSLLSAFAGSCQSTVGTWTSDALSHTQSLISTMQQLRDSQDKDCTGVTGALDSLNRIYDEMNRLAIDPTIQHLRTAQANRQDLLNAIQGVINSTANPDPNLVTALQHALYSVMVDLANAQAQVRTQDLVEKRQRVVSGLSQITQYMSALLNQDSNLTACYAAAPYMAFQMAGALASIGGSFATPIVGAALNAAGHLVSASVNFIRHHEIDSAILDGKNTQMHRALSCGLESMSNLYCDAQSTQRFLNLAADSYRSLQREGWEPAPVWRGMDLLGRRLPVLNTWLMQVLGGVQPQDPNSAHRQNEIWDRVNDLKNYRRKIQGIFNRTKTLSDGANEKDRETYLRRALLDAIGTLYRWSGQGGGGGGGGGGPFAQYFTSIFATICALMADEKCKPPEQIQDPNDFISRYQIIGGFGGLTFRAYAMLDSADKLAANELKREINQDPDLLLTSAKTQSKDNLSPLEVLQALEKFFQESADYYRKNPKLDLDGAVQKLALATAQRIQKVVAEILNEKAKPLEVIDLIFEQFWLLTGTQVITDRVTQLIRWDMEGRIRNKELPPDLSKDLLASGRELADELERSGFPVEDLTPILGRIKDAKTTSVENLEQFTSFFKGNINRSISALKEIAERTKDPDDRWALGRLCILALTTNKEIWDDDLDLEACEGIVLNSAYKESGIQLSFDKILREFHSNPNLPLSRRMCRYYDFLRESRIYRLRNSVDDHMFGKSFLDSLMGPLF